LRLFDGTIDLFLQLPLLVFDHFFRYASVHAYYVLFNQASSWQLVETIQERFIKLFALVPPLDLIIKAVKPRYTQRLMVASEYPNPVRVANLKRKQQGNHLRAHLASIHIVTHEKVVVILVNDAALLTWVCVSHLLEDL
jgi:hypothetical protein